VGDGCTISTKKIKNQKSKFDVNCTRAGLEMTHWKPYYTYNFEAGKEKKFDQ
jgi:hypothetical protein